MTVATAARSEDGRRRGGRTRRAAACYAPLGSWLAGAMETAVPNSNPSRGAASAPPSTPFRSALATMPKPSAPFRTGPRSAPPPARISLAMAIATTIAILLFATGCGGEKDPYVRGEAALKARDTKTAAREFQLAIDADPRRYDARVRLAHCQRLLGQRDRAIASFEKAAALNPGDPYPLFSIVLCHFEEGQSLAAKHRRGEADAAFDLALAAGERLSASFPGEARGHELAARVHVSRFANYFAAVRAILVDHFSDAEVDRMVRRLTADVYAPDWGPAKRGALGEFFQREFPFRDIEPLLAAIDDLRKEYEAVVASYEKALDLDPTLTSASRDLASILVQVGSLDEGLKVAQELRVTDLESVKASLDADELRQRELDVNHAHWLIAEIEERRAHLDALEERERRLEPAAGTEDEDEPARVAREDRFRAAAAELEAYVQGRAPAAEKLRAREKLCRYYYEIGERASLKTVSEAIRKEKPGNAVGKLFYGIALYLEDPKGKLSNAINLIQDALLAIPDERHGHYVLGLAYRDQKKVTQAVQALRKAIALDGDDPEAHRALLEISLDQGWHEDALVEARDLLRLDARNAATRRLVERAEREALNRGPIEAPIRNEDEARAILRRDPGQLYARFRLAEFLILSRNAAGALREIEQILKARPRFYPALILEARAVAQRGDVARARFLLQDLANREPNRPDAYLTLARMDYALHRGRSALRYLRVADRIAPDEPETALFDAEIKLEAGLVKPARDSIEKVRKIDPGNKKAAVLGARIALLGGKPEKAEKEMRELVAADPDYAPARLELARALVALSRDAEAEAALRELLSNEAAAEPDEEAAARAILVDICARADRVDDVLEQLLLLVERGQHGVAALALSRVHEAHGHPESAIAALRQGLRFRPEDAEILMRLGDLSLEAGDKRAAFRFYQRTTRVDPQNAVALRAIANLGGDGGTQQERKALLKALKANPKDVDLNVRLAEMLLAERKYPSVKKILKADKTPDNVKKAPAMLAIEVQLHRAMGDPDTAKKKLAALAAEAAPDEARIYAPLAFALGDPRLAEDLLLKALEAPPEEKDEPDEKANLGLALLRQIDGDFAGAHRFVDSALSSNPGSLAARTFSAFLFAAEGRHKEALDRLDGLFPDEYSENEFRAALDSASATPGLEKEVARLFNEAIYYSGSPALRNVAAESFRRIIAILPQNALAYDRLAMLHLDANDRLSALRTLEEQMKRNPDYVPAYVRAGRLLFKMNRASEGERLFREALDLAPSDPALRREMAERFASRGKPVLLREALRHAERALELDPGKNADLLVLMGRIHERLGDAGAAIAALEDAIAKRPDDPAAYQALLKIYRADKDAHKKEARRLCEEMAKRFPENLDTRDLLARLLVSDRKFDEAKAEFEAMREEQPFVAAPFAGLAEVAHAKGDTAEEFRMRRAAVALDPGRWRDALILAEDADRRGDVRAAAELYETVLAFQQDNRDARLRLVEIECERKRFESGLLHAQIGASKFPEDEAMKASLGWALYMSGQNVEAQKVLEQVVEEKPRYAIGHFHLGNVLARRRLNERAAEEIRIAIDLGLPPDIEKKAEILLNDIAPKKRGGRARGAVEKPAKPDKDAPRPAEGPNGGSSEDDGDGEGEG